MADEKESRGEAHLIEHLVGSVLGSVVKAQGLAASQLLDMVQTIGFREDGQARTFNFSFDRIELDPATNQKVRRNVTAAVPLLTLINLPSIAIQEAKIEMDLRLVAHESQGDTSEDKPMKLFVVPAKKQLVRTADQAFAIDSAGTIKLSVTMRQESALGLDKLRSLLEGGTTENVTTVTPA